MLSLLRKNTILKSHNNLKLQFESVFESAVDGIIIINDVGIILDVNKAASELFQYTKNELIGIPVTTIMPQHHAAQHDRYISDYLTTRKPKIIGIGREVEGLRKDGSQFPFWLSVNEVDQEEGKIFTGFIHDLSAVRKAEKELVKLNEDLENKVVQRTYDLEKVVNQLLHLNKQFEDEIIARKFTEEQLKLREAELQKSLEREKELGELKSRFVSIASHEFRTPLATISSSASLITKYVDETTQANRVKHIDKIKSSVAHLTNILNDFLSISKLEEGKAQARLSECNVEDIAHDFLEEIKPLVTQNKSFIPEITLKEKILCTDPNILKNILFNLVSNAIKYTKQNGIITLKLYDDDQNLHLVVSDNGIGIPLKDQKHLFDRFFRAENASNLEGTGLGLFIVKKYSELLHGDISFTSTEITGTTFTLILPKIKPCINP